MNDSVKLVHTLGTSSDGVGARPDVELVPDPRFGSYRVELESRRRRRWRRVKTTLAILTALVVLAAVTLELPVLSVEHVKITGAVNTSRAAIVDAAGLSDHPAMAFLSMSGIERKVGALPWVKSASATRRWPATVDIQVVERKATAQVRLASGGWAEMDGHGRVLGLSAADPGLLTVSAQGAIGRPGSMARGRLLSGALVARMVPQALRASVAEVAIASDGVAGLVLADHSEVILGSVAHLSAKFAAAVSVLRAIGWRSGGAAPVIVNVVVPSAPTVAAS